MDLVPVIGLEVHIQLATSSKIFSGDTTSFGSEPNSQVTEVSLGYPGTLPVLNRKAIELAIRLSIALGCEVNRTMHFDRKNYFYPDLPKGYQITQDRTPVGSGGSVHFGLDGTDRRVQLRKIHLEEDAGKLMHTEGGKSHVDFNRAGVPLVELVTEPVISTDLEAVEFLQEIRRIVRYLGIGDGNMEEGSLRCDANVSVMERGSEVLGSKVEVKNMNSFKRVQKAIRFEIQRQRDLVEQGRKVVAETRLYDIQKEITIPMRLKEDLQDYRYFPEPDLPVVEVGDALINEISATVTDLPYQLSRKFTQEYSIPEYDATVLTEDRNIALYFEETCKKTKNYKAVSNLLMGPVKSFINQHRMDINDCGMSPEELAKAVEMMDSGVISNQSVRRHLIPELLKSGGGDPQKLAEKLNLLGDVGTGNLQSVVEDVIGRFPEEVELYRNGKKKVIGVFIGEIMKETSGKADPKSVKELLEAKLG